LGLAGEYATDDAELARYAKMARSAEGFAAYLQGFAPPRGAAA
jgi:glutaconate CoA-transferase subunit A